MDKGTGKIPAAAARIFSVNQLADVKN